MSSSAPAARRVLAVSLLAAIAALATACSGGGSPGPTVTVTKTASSGSGTPATTPATTAPATTPAVTSPPGIAECATAALGVGIGSGQGAAGTIYYNIDFTNISSSTCFLQGYPGISLVSAGSNAGSQIGADAKRNPLTPIRAITLAPGQTAHAMLGIAQAALLCPQPVTAHWLKVFPPDQTVAAYVAISTQTCASTSKPTMHITAISSGA